MINYQQLKQAQSNGSPLPHAVFFPLSCQVRLEEGEPEVKAGLYFEKSEHSYEKKNVTHHHLSKNIYRLANGEICTLTEAAAQLELSESRTTDLFTRYCNRWSTVHKNHGVNGAGNKFKTPDGKPSTLIELGKLYGYSEASISRYFSEAGGDYILANEKLKKMSDERARNAKEKAPS